MPKVTYIDDAEHSRCLDLEVGRSLMEAAVEHDVSGIIGQCGGVMACSTCHVYVDDAWVQRLTNAQPVSDYEAEMLEGVLGELRLESRLACQLRVSDELDGLVVRVADSQL